MLGSAAFACEDTVLTLAHQGQEVEIPFACVQGAMVDRQCAERADQCGARAPCPG